MQAIQIESEQSAIFYMLVLFGSSKFSVHRFRASFPDKIVTKLSKLAAPQLGEEGLPERDRAQ